MRVPVQVETLNEAEELREELVRHLSNPLPADEPDPTMLRLLFQESNRVSEGDPYFYGTSPLGDTRSACGTVAGSACRPNCIHDTGTPT